MWLAIIFLLGLCALYGVLQNPKVKVYIEGLPELSRFELYQFELLDDKVKIDEEYIIPLERILYVGYVDDLGSSGWTKTGRYKSRHIYYMEIHYKELSGKENVMKLTSEVNPSCSLDDFLRIRNRINKIKNYQPPSKKNVKKKEREI
jgi:hypothetical protein